MIVSFSQIVWNVKISELKKNLKHSAIYYLMPLLKYIINILSLTLTCFGLQEKIQQSARINLSKYRII